MPSTRRVIRVTVAAVLLAAGLAAAPRPVPATATPGGPYLARAFGLTDVVTNGTHAFATVREENVVRVLSLAGGVLEAAIPVGTSPVGLDLSIDGSLLYVANSESNDVSVVDLALRREVRRIPVPAMERTGRPFSIAVAANGTALLSRTGDGKTLQPARLLSVDLATGAMRERTDLVDLQSTYNVRLRASADRSSIGVAREKDGYGSVTLYTSATDGFSPTKHLGDTSFVALDGTGSKVLSGPDTLVLDRELILRATVPGRSATPGASVTDVAVGASGGAAYRLRGEVIEVVDLTRALVAATIRLPESAYGGAGRLVLTPDGSTLVALTALGFSVAPVSSATTATCIVPAVPAGVLPVCGAPLTDMVVDNRGRAYVSNTARNQVEVLSLTGRRIETSIPVGSAPTGLALSPDGNTLYVANSGAEELSVVDVAQRREVRRITLPIITPSGGSDRPFSLAVAANGIALLATRSEYDGSARQLLQVDLTSGTFTHRVDAPGAALYARSSGDHRRIGFVPGGGGKLFVYDSDSDSFSPGRSLPGPLVHIALDGDGSELMVASGQWGWDSGVYRLDRDLVRRATFPSAFDLAILMNPAGTRLFNLGSQGVGVHDVQRGLSLRYVRLPESMAHQKSAAMALTPDEATLAVLSPSGVSFVPTSPEGPPDECQPPPAPPGVTAICGQLADVVSAGGKVYASNATYNRIEVLSLADGRLEEPIPVGSRPQGLDFSADGRLLYVALSGAEEVSVVDVAARRELRRITVRSPHAYDTPASIAVSSRGIALVATGTFGNGTGGHLHQIDLATDAVSLRQDYNGGRVTDDAVLGVSGDRTRVVVASTDSGGEVTIYRSEFDSFGPERLLYEYLAFAAVDRSGDRILFNTGATLNGDLAPVGDVTGDGKGVVLTRSGTTAYRVRENTVEVIDMATRKVTRTLPLPQVVAQGVGAVALSADEQVLAVLTVGGVSWVPINPSTPGTPYTVWTQPGAVALDGIGTWVAVADDPQAGAGQLAPSYTLGHSFAFAKGGATGAIALVTRPEGKYAVFTIVEPVGPPRTAAVPFAWREGGFYFLFVYQVSPGLWGAWVYTHPSATPVPIGSFSLPVGWAGLAPTTVTVSSWTGIAGLGCGAYPLADIFYYPPIGFTAGSTTPATLVTATQAPGDCASRTSLELGVWSRHRLGAGA